MNTWAITRQDILITGSIAAVAIGLAGLAGCSSTDSAPTAAPTTVYKRQHRQSGGRRANPTTG